MAEDNSPHQVLYQKNWDKESQHILEEDFKGLIKSVTGYCIQSGTAIISEADVVAAIMAKVEEITQTCKALYMKYRENDLAIKIFEQKVSGRLVIEGPELIRDLKALQDEEIKIIAVKHKLMDRTIEKEPWEDTVRKKFWLTDEEEWTPVLDWILHRMKTAWKREVFLETCFMILKHGDIVKLVSGVNDAGKTWTSIPQPKFANWLLRNFWPLYLKNLPYPNDKNPAKAEAKWKERLSIIARLEVLPRYRMKENIIFYPDPERVRMKISDGSSFNTINVNEGMKAAINLKSWDPETIDMILEIFTERASNNYLVFEYQVAKRPPKLLQARFNVWQHKMNQKWMVVSMPSSIYRTEDPLYTSEIEKIKGDRKISRWFTHRSGNTNFVAKMHAPRMTEKDDAKFKKLRKIAKEEYEKGRTVKKGLGVTEFTKLAELHEEVMKGQKAKDAIPELMRAKYRYNPDQITKFMRAFDKYDRQWKLMHPDTGQESLEVMEDG